MDHFSTLYFFPSQPPPYNLRRPWAVSRGVKASSLPVCHRVLHSLDISFDIHHGVISNILPRIALLASSVGINLVSSSARVKSVKSQHQVYLSLIKMIAWYNSMWLLTTAGSSQEYGKHIRSLVLSNGQANPGACHVPHPSPSPLPILNLFSV